MIRKLCISGTATFQAQGPECGVPVLCPSALAQCSILPEHQRSKAEKPSCKWAGFWWVDMWAGVSFPQCRHLVLSEMIMSLAWEPPICFFRMSQRSCTICRLYSDVSDTPPKSKKILGDYVSATVSYPECGRCFPEFESEFTCLCVHRAMRNKRFTVYVLELNVCTVFSYAQMQTCCTCTCSQALLRQVHMDLPQVKLVLMLKNCLQQQKTFKTKKALSLKHL